MEVETSSFIVFNSFNLDEKSPFRYSSSCLRQLMAAFFPISVLKSQVKSSMKKLYILKNVLEYNFNMTTVNEPSSAEIVLKVTNQLKGKQGPCESYYTSLFTLLNTCLCLILIYPDFGNGLD